MTSKPETIGSNEENDERDYRVYALRTQGFTYDQIAKEVGFSGPSGAWKAYQRSRQSMIYESAEETRLLELMRLDSIQFAIWPQADKGHIPSITCLLRIMERRAKLLGLDKLETKNRNQWEINGAEIDAEVQRIINMMNEREDEFMSRREAEVRAEMRAQFELERRLEKELAQREGSEDTKKALLEMLKEGKEKNEWKTDWPE